MSLAMELLPEPVCPTQQREQDMRIEKFSLKALTVSVLLVVGIVAVAFSFVSESEYRKAAVQSQTRAVARILDVATDAALTRLALDSDQLAAAAVKAIGRQPGLGAYLAEAPAGAANPTLAKLLEARRASVGDGERLDWAMGETMASWGVVSPLYFWVNVCLLKASSSALIRSLSTASSTSAAVTTILGRITFPSG